MTICFSTLIYGYYGFTTQRYHMNFGIGTYMYHVDARPPRQLCCVHAPESRFTKCTEHESRVYSRTNSTCSTAHTQPAPRLAPARPPRAPAGGSAARSLSWYFLGRAHDVALTLLPALQPTLAASTPPQAVGAAAAASLVASLATSTGEPLGGSSTMSSTGESLGSGAGGSAAVGGSLRGSMKTKYVPVTHARAHARTHTQCTGVSSAQSESSARRGGALRVGGAGTRPPSSQSP